MYHPLHLDQMRVEHDLQMARLHRPQDEVTTRRLRKARRRSR